jgi:hypothetical protein
MILLPLVDGRRQAVGLLPGDGAEHPLFGGHGRIIERPPGEVNEGSVRFDFSVPFR